MAAIGELDRQALLDAESVVELADRLASIFRAAALGRCDGLRITVFV